MKHCNKKQLAVELTDWETTAKLQIVIPDVKCRAFGAAMQQEGGAQNEPMEWEDNPPLEYWLLRRH